VLASDAVAVELDPRDRPALEGGKISLVGLRARHGGQQQTGSGAEQRPPPEATCPEHGATIYVRTSGRNATLVLCRSGARHHTRGERGTARLPTEGREAVVRAHEGHPGIPVFRGLLELV